MRKLGMAALAAGAAALVLVACGGTTGSYEPGDAVTKESGSGTGPTGIYGNPTCGGVARGYGGPGRVGGSGGSGGSPNGTDDRGECVVTEQLGLYSLQATENCDEVTAQWRKAAAEAMEYQLETNLQRLLDPPDCYDDWGWGDSIACDAGAMAEIASYEEEDDESADEYSTTNTQVVGVDEADFMKNDGAYIYILADNRFQIVDAWPPEQAHKLSSTFIEGIPRKMFVHKDVAVIYSSIGGTYGWQECTYGYDCEFTGDGNELKVTVLDISDLESPSVTREMFFDGSYLNSRRVEDYVYTVVYFPDPPAPVMKYWPVELLPYQYHCVEYWDDEAPELPFGADEIKELFEELRQENLQIVENSTVADWLPGMQDYWYVDGSPVIKDNPLGQCDGYYLSQTKDGASLLSLISFDLTANKPAKASTIIARPGAVYATKQSLYVAVRHYYGWGSMWFGELEEGDNEATTLHKFLLASDSPETAYSGSGVVKGRVLNQFAMGEYEGNLRIATTMGQVPMSGVHSTVSVLEHKDKGLHLIGQLDDLAPGEDIRSVRFGGSLGFIVTFKKTDPLFVIDLSKPTAPVIKGELKIPGFSTYMHFMDSKHLLTIGYDADDQGSFAWFQGIMLQVFDVTDITDPKLTHKEVIGTRGTMSDAATNHLAFNFFKPKELLAIPMVVCEEGSGGYYGEEMTFNGLMVYKVTVEDGFEYQGGVPHSLTQQSWGTCSSWWTESDSKVKRSVFMDDYVYSVAVDHLKAAALDDLDYPVATVNLD